LGACAGLCLTCTEGSCCGELGPESSSSCCSNSFACACLSRARAMPRRVLGTQHSHTIYVLDLLSCPVQGFVPINTRNHLSRTHSATCDGAQTAHSRIHTLMAYKYTVKTVYSCKLVATSCLVLRNARCHNAWVSAQLPWFLSAQIWLIYSFRADQGPRAAVHGQPFFLL
jgi:hypothetical protein